MPFPFLGGNQMDIEKLLKFIMEYSKEKNVNSYFRPVDIWGIHNLEIRFEKGGVLDALFINPTSFDYDSVIKTVEVMIDNM